MLVTELLWLSEDELRQVCLDLEDRLYQSEVEKLVLLSGLIEARNYGYRCGYVDRALQLPYAAEEGNAEGHTVH
jgi:hypothetical protein